MKERDWARAILKEIIAENFLKLVKDQTTGSERSTNSR